MLPWVHCTSSNHRSVEHKADTRCPFLPYHAGKSNHLCGEHEPQPGGGLSRGGGPGQWSPRGGGDCGHTGYGWVLRPAAHPVSPASCSCAHFIHSLSIVAALSWSVNKYGKRRMHGQSERLWLGLQEGQASHRSSLAASTWYSGRCIQLTPLSCRPWSAPCRLALIPGNSM